MNAIVTGSGGERFMYCPASSVLPRSYDMAEETDDRTRGQEIHGYLERIGDGFDPETSLDLVDPRWRLAAREIDLRSVRDLTALEPEVALAYHPDTDTARVLGSAIGRAYDGAGVTADEIPLTVDVLGVGPSVTFNADYKTGWGRIMPVVENWQMKVGAIATARAFDRDEHEGQLVFLREGKPVRRDRHVFDSVDLVTIGGDLRRRLDQARLDRERFEATGAIPDANKGTWCKHCPSRFVCPAQHALIRAAIDHASHPVDPKERVRLMTPDELGEAFRKLRKLEPAVDDFKAAIYARAAIDPILIETEPDGTEVWLGMAPKIGKEELDPDVVAEVLTELWPDDPDVITDVMKREVTKNRLEPAIRSRVARGQGAARIRRVLDLVAARGGSHRALKSSVHVYKLKAGVVDQERPLPELRVIEGGLGDGDGEGEAA